VRVIIGRISCKVKTHRIQLGKSGPAPGSKSTGVLDSEFQESWLKTFVAILLSFLTGLPVAAPLYATGKSSLPICCRRDGKHHCVKVAGQENGDTNTSFSTVETKCPRFPQSMGLTVHCQPGLSTSSAVFAEIVSHPAIVPQTQSNYRVSLLRSHQKRGPPAVVLA